MNSSTKHNAFGLIIVGDEILLGTKEDKHFTYFRQMLGQRGQRLDRCWFLPDNESSLIKHFMLSMEEGFPDSPLTITTFYPAFRKWPGQWRDG